MIETAERVQGDWFATARTLGAQGLRELAYPVALCQISHIWAITSKIPAAWAMDLRVRSLSRHRARAA